MMVFTIKEAEHVARLARLDLDEAEKQAFAEQLNAILKYGKKLHEIPTAGIEPLVHILPVDNVMRSDEIKPSLPREKIIANAPLVEDGQYKVPKIM